MASADVIQSLKNDEIAERDAAQAKIDKLDQLSASITEEVNASYDQGVKDNQAAVGNADGKIYSLEEANALIEEQTGPLKSQIADLGVKIADLQAKVDAAPDVEAAKKEEREKVKQEILSKLDEQQASESEGEANLKSVIAGI